MPRLDADRLITILDAANKVLYSFANLRANFENYRQADVSEISLDSLMDIFNRYTPTIEDITTIVSERNHFTTSKERLQTAKLGMQRVRGDRKSAPEVAAELAKIGLGENKLDRPSDQSSPATPDSYKLPENPTLEDYWELLRQTFGADKRGIFSGTAALTIQKAKPDLSDADCLAIIGDLLDTRPSENSIQYLSKGQMDNIFINDVAARRNAARPN